MRRDPRTISNVLFKILGSRGIIKAAYLFVFFFPPKTELRPPITIVSGIRVKLTFCEF